MSSWFNSSASTGTITDTEGKENAIIQYHKSANFLTEVNAAVGTDFYNKMYYSLAEIIEQSGDLMLGFLCKWSQIVQADEEALRPMVKRLNHFVHSKEYKKGWHIYSRYVQ